MWTCPNCGREFKRTNQNHYCGKPPSTIEEYISNQDPSIQPILIQLRTTIHEAIPNSTETISWGMPTWKRKGNLIHFAVSKNHIGIYVTEEAISHFADQLKEYETNKGVIRLKFNKELPLKLISNIAQWSYAADA